MALNSSVCSNRECHIECFDVLAVLDGDDVEFTVVDPCNVLTSQRLLKLILQLAYEAHLEANAEILTAEVAAGSCGDGCECPFGPPGFDFYFGEKRAVYTPSETSGLDVEASSEVTYEVCLPPAE